MDDNEKLNEAGAFMKGLPVQTWILLFVSTVPWLLLTFFYVSKVKRVDRQRSRSKSPES